MSSNIALIAAAFFLVAGLLYMVSRARARRGNNQSSTRPDGSGVMASMRRRLLAGNPKEFGIAPVGTVWGLLMEMGYPEGWASLVALADGTASLYLSSGGGIIGGGFHEKVKGAAFHLCNMAASLGRVGSLATEFPTPGPGRIRFYILTIEGVQVVEEAEHELGAGGHKLSPLFMAAHEVITQLRRVADARPGS